MAIVTRDCFCNNWNYIPIEDIDDFFVIKKANVNNSKMFSENGPITEIYYKETPNHMLVISKMIDNGILLSKNESLLLNEDGKVKDEIMKCSLSPRLDKEDGIKIVDNNVLDGEIVMTAWPSNKTIVPGKISKTRHGLFVEIPFLPNKGDRCFVLNESGKGLITLSMPSSGSELIKSWPQMSFLSWLYNSGSPSMYDRSKRYSVNNIDGKIEIIDNTNKNILIFSYKTYGKNVQKKIEMILSIVGTSGIISLGIPFEAKEK